MFLYTLDIKIEEVIHHYTDNGLTAVYLIRFQIPDILLYSYLDASYDI